MQLFVLCTDIPLDLDGLGHGLADVAHGGPGLGGLEGRVAAVRPRDGQLAVVVGDVGVWPRLCHRVHTARKLELLPFFLLP